MAKRKRERDDLVAEVPTEKANPNLVAFWDHKERMRDKLFAFVLDLAPFALILVGLILVALGHSATDVKTVLGGLTTLTGGGSYVGRRLAKTRA